MPRPAQAVPEVPMSGLNDLKTVPPLTCRPLLLAWAVAATIAAAVGLLAWTTRPAAPNVPVASTAPGRQAGPAGRSAEPSTPEEKTVAAWILQRAVNPRSVVFVKWGPHQDLPPPGHRGQRLVRVSYRATNEQGAGQFYERSIYL